MAEKTTNGSRGLMESLTTLTSTLVAIAHTRLDLLSTDLEEEREHLLSLMMLNLVALFCFCIGVVLAMILLTVVFWDTHRLLVLGLLTGFYLTASVATWAFAVRKARIKPRLFAASMSELLKDREQFDPRS
jgi:uncharacterized membrane protein YqjE